MRSKDIDFLICAFLIGAAIGSIITYWKATREKRFVSRVRHAIETLGYHHKFDQWPRTPGWLQKTADLSKITNYEEILALYAWADRVSYHLEGATIHTSKVYHMHCANFPHHLGRQLGWEQDFGNPQTILQNSQNWAASALS